jgi:hypothetical protein
MFDVEERERVRERLLGLAGADPSIVGAAVTGSYALGSGDRWSDIDLAPAVDGPIGAALERWTGLLAADFGALHHWDLPSGSSVYRVFLLPGWLEADIAFTPAADFGPTGPSWRSVFGEAAEPEPAGPPSRDRLVGLAWHHALHARICVERRRWWQAEQWISGLRGQVLALACLRLGHPTAHAKGAHLLPPEVTAPLEKALVGSLDEAALRFALAAAAAALVGELDCGEPALAARLGPVLGDLTRSGGTGR